MAAVNIFIQDGGARESAANFRAWGGRWFRRAPGLTRWRHPAEERRVCGRPGCRGADLRQPVCRAEIFGTLPRRKIFSGPGAGRRPLPPRPEPEPALRAASAFGLGAPPGEGRIPAFSFCSLRAGENLLDSSNQPGARPLKQESGGKYEVCVIAYSRARGVRVRFRQTVLRVVFGGQRFKRRLPGRPV